jgi:hypothetical protein
MPEDTIASAAWRTWASVIPHPKLFQLFQPSGGVRAGLPGAAEAGEWAEAVTDAVTVRAAAASRRRSRPRERLSTKGSFGVVRNFEHRSESRDVRDVRDAGGCVNRL